MFPKVYDTNHVGVEPDTRGLATGLQPGQGGKNSPPANSHQITTRVHNLYEFEVEMSDKRDIPEGFTGIWIPNDLYAFPQLDSADRELIACVISFHKGNKRFVSVSYMASLVGITRANCSKRITKLVKAGFIRRDDRNRKMGGANMLKPTGKSLGLSIDDMKGELQASNNKGSSGGCIASDTGGVSPAIHPVPPAIHDNKKINKNITSSSKPANAGFDFDLVFLFVMSKFREAGYDVDDVIEKTYIEEKLKEYQAGKKKPTQSEALSHIDIALKNRHGVKARSAKAAAARDKLNTSTVNLITAQATGKDQKALAIAPKTTDQKLSDRSWAEGLDLDFDE